MTDSCVTACHCSAVRRGGPCLRGISGRAPCALLEARACGAGGRGSRRAFGRHREACPSLLLLPLGPILVRGSPEERRWLCAGGGGRRRAVLRVRGWETGRGEGSAAAAPSQPGKVIEPAPNFFPTRGVDVRSLWRAASRDPVTQPAETAARAAEQKRRLSEAGGGRITFLPGHGVSGQPQLPRTGESSAGSG